MKRLRELGYALLIGVVLATTASAGTDLNLRVLYKGSVASADAPIVATARDVIILGDGTGASKAKAIRAASSSTALGLYVKCGGVRPTDAEWSDAQPLLWRSASGTVYTQGQNGWSYADLQRFPNQWAAAVVIPHIRATLAAVPAGTYSIVMVDNAVQQHPSLFAPNAPPDYDFKAYHDATLVVLRQIRMALPGMRIIPNGWQGWAPEGLRGEALGGNDPATGLPWADGIWFEGLAYSTGGKAQPPARFTQDLGAFMSFVTNGKLAVWDEPGVSGAKWREAAGQMIAATGRAAWALSPSAVENALLSVDGPQWQDWWR